MPTNPATATPLQAQAEHEDIVRWRDRFLVRALRYAFFLGLLTAIPGLWAAVRDGVWTVVAIDALALGGMAALWRMRSLGYIVRATGLLAIIFVLSVFFMNRVALVGLIYLMAFPMITSLLLGLRPALVALAVDAAILAVTGLLAGSGLVAEPIASLPPLRWLAFSFNFLFVVGLITVFVALMMRRLEDSLLRFELSNALLVEEAAARHHAEVALLQLNAELEQRVHSRTAQLQAAVAELESFSYAVSHDLRAPLGTIDGFSGTLERQLPQDGPQRHYISRIRAATRQMSELIDAMLLLAQVSRDRMRWEQVDLSAVAQPLLRSYQEAHPQRSVQVDVQPGMLAHGDQRLLRQLLDNLLSNAWKFSEGKAGAAITFRRQVGPQGEDVYEVRDNGAGFDMAHADRLFHAFHRLHRPEDFSGNGIGLATAHKIVTRHGGRIWAEAVPGEGAAFFFTLGASAPPEPARRAHPREAAQP